MKQLTFFKVPVFIVPAGFAYSIFLQHDKQQTIGKAGKDKSIEKHKAADLQLLFTSREGFISLLFP